MERQRSYERDEAESEAIVVVKRGRGRPRKDGLVTKGSTKYLVEKGTNKLIDANSVSTLTTNSNYIPPEPKASSPGTNGLDSSAKKKRGRPRKQLLSTAPDDDLSNRAPETPDRRGYSEHNNGQQDINISEQSDARELRRQNASVSIKLTEFPIDVSGGRLRAQNSSVLHLTPANGSHLAKSKELSDQILVPESDTGSRKKRGRPRKDSPAAFFPSSFGLSTNPNEPLSIDANQIEQDANGDLIFVPSKRRGRPRIYPESGALSALETKLLSLGDDMKTLSEDKLSEQDLAHSQRIFQELIQGDRGATLQNFNAFRTVVTQKLTQRRRLRLIKLDDEFRKVEHLLRQTVVTGESNSMLLIGPRGCGKTTLIETAIDQLISSNRDDFHVIRLNGFIHTDDKIALKEIWRQLGREMNTENGVAGLATNQADTLLSLLALLSQSSETQDNNPQQMVKSVIFILDEFDLFASHSRQTLLYNLFDISQSRKAPIAVIGTTTQVNAVELLEKRVKSRFSHRYVYVSMPKSLDVYWNICKEALTVSDADLEGDEFSILETPEGAQFRSLWSAMLDDIYEKSSEFRDYLARHYALSCTPALMFASLLLPISILTVDMLPPSAEFMSQRSLHQPDSKLELLPSLSDLSIALLICATRVAILLDIDTCNFNMAYGEYVGLASRAKLHSSTTAVLATGSHTGKVWSKATAAIAWEALMKLELLIPAISASGGGGVSAMARMYRVDVALNEIESAVGRRVASDELTKWCRSL